MKKNIFYKILTIPSFFYNYFYRKRLRVLAYHDVKGEKQFYRHLEYLKEKYNIISIEDVRNTLKNKADFPTNSLLITFDDGDISVLEKGLPVLKKLEVPSCLFIITGLINTHTDFWFSAIRKHEKLNGKNQQEIENLMSRLKAIKNVERIDEINKYNFPMQKQLTSQNLIDLKEGKVFIANHSHTHPMFDRCSQDELRTEFKMTLLKFKEFQLEEGNEYFAYPNGNWDNSSEVALKEMDIKIAFLFDHKINKRNINPYRISRIRTNSDMSIDELKVKVSGLHSAFQKIKNFK